MTRPELGKKVDAIAEEFERGNWYGTIEIEFKDGTPHYVRRTFSECVREEGRAQTHANYSKR